MSDLGRRDQGSVDRRVLRRVGIVAVALGFGFAVAAAPVVGDGLNRQATPNSPRIVGTTAATQAQVAGANVPHNHASASAKKKQKRKVKKPVRTRQVFVESRITDSAAPIVTEEGRGTFVGIRCPAGSKAISGGVLTSYINLLVSSSAPNHPITGAYTPRVWWITVTNANIDGQGGSLAWRGMVNCMSPVRLKSS